MKILRCRGKTEIEREFPILFQAEIIENMLGIPTGFLIPIIELKIMLVGPQIERIGIEFHYLTSAVGGISEITLRRRMFRSKDISSSQPGHPAVPVASSGGLSNGIQTSQSAIDHWKIQIHSSFHYLGTDYPAYLLILQSPPYLSKPESPVGRAHPGAEMEVSLARSNGIEQ